MLTIYYTLIPEDVPYWKIIVLIKKAKNIFIYFKSIKNMSIKMAFKYLSSKNHWKFVVL